MALLQYALPNSAYKLLLILAAAIWGLGTVVIKDTLSTISPFWVVGIRFTSAGILLSVVLLPRILRTVNKSHLKAGLVLGFLVGITYLLNTTGLVYTSASNSSFLTATYCIFVPFLSWLCMKKRPTFFNLLAAFLCIVGIGFVALPHNTTSSFNLGDILTLISSLTCGLHIVFIAKLAPGKDMVVLTALQFLVAGAMGLGWDALNGSPPPLEIFDSETIGSFAYLVLCATCITLLLQNIGLAKVDPAPASLALSTEAVFGVVFSISLLGETLTLQILFGFLLIFFAVLVSEWMPHVYQRRREKYRFLQRQETQHSKRCRKQNRQTSSDEQQYERT